MRLKHSAIVKRFQEEADKLPLSAPPPFEDSEEDVNYDYLTFVRRSPRGRGYTNYPHSVLRVRVEKGEQLKTQSNKASEIWSERC